MHGGIGIGGGPGGPWRGYLRYDDSIGQQALDRRLARRALSYARPYLPHLAGMLATILAIALLELIPPLLYRDLIDTVLPDRDSRRLNVVAGGLLAVPVLTGVLGVAQRYLGSRAGEGIIADLRQGMYEHLQRMSLRFFTHTKSGEIISRFNNDVVGAQTAITGTLPSIATSTITLVTTLAVMLRIDWRLSLIAVAVLPLFLLPTRRVGRILRDIRRRRLDVNADLSSLIQETLSISGVLLVKTFGRQVEDVDRFGGLNRAVRDLGVRQAIVGRWFFMGLAIATAIGTALIYWVGGILVIRSGPNPATGISIGTLVAFAAYLSRLYGPIAALSNVQVEFATSMVSFERVFEYLDLPIEIADRPNARAIGTTTGHIVFHDVSFGFRDPEAGMAPGRPEEPGDSQAGCPAPPAAGDASRRWALADLSFEIRPGQLVALVGPSGAGKTTLTYLMLRLYDPSKGRVTIDGIDLRDVTLESLASQFGVVTQETYLFHDTVLANLQYARPGATIDEVRAACRAARIHELIQRMPSAYETMVGERGYRLSGGEKQRLAIARVILKNPRILILDEATSHLDSQSEVLIQAALEPLFVGRTSLVIAHRLSTILKADHILVLDSGRLVEQGCHEELLRRGGLYAHLHETQFGPAPASAGSKPGEQRGEGQRR